MRGSHSAGAAPVGGYEPPPPVLAPSRNNLSHRMIFLFLPANLFISYHRIPPPELY
jgi:hypothetical protein